jgi:acylphosphatase
MQTIRHFLVTGRVQGVGFRYATASKANALNLSGWVKNLASGEVETIVQGETNNVEEFESWLWAGPKYARVKNVEQTPAIEQRFDGFQIL